MADEEKGDHNYTADTVIAMSLSIGFATARQEDDISIEDLTGLDDDELQSMTQKEVEDHIREGVKEWAYEYIDYGWEVEE